MCEEGWERDFLPTGCVKKGGKGSSCPRGVSRRVGKGVQEGWEREPMGCVKRGVKGISCPWGVSRRVGKGVGAHPRGEEGWEREFAPMGCVKRGVKGSFPAHGGGKISHPWGVSRRVGKGVRAHGVCQVKKKAPTVVERLGLFLG